MLQGSSFSARDTRTSKVPSGLVDPRSPEVLAFVCFEFVLVLVRIKKGDPEFGSYFPCSWAEIDSIHAALVI
jgi:hypothetical protein